MIQGSGSGAVGFPFRAHQLAAAKVGGNDAHASTIRTRRQPFTLAHETGGPRNEDEKERETWANKERLRCPMAAAKVELGAQKKALGVGVTP